MLAESSNNNSSSSPYSGQISIRPNKEKCLNTSSSQLQLKKSTDTQSNHSSVSPYGRLNTSSGTAVLSQSQIALTKLNAIASSPSNAAGMKYTPYQPASTNQVASSIYNNFKAQANSSNNNNNNTNNSYNNSNNNSNASGISNYSKPPYQNVLSGLLPQQAQASSAYQNFQAGYQNTNNNNNNPSSNTTTPPASHWMNEPSSLEYATTNSTNPTNITQQQQNYISYQQTNQYGNGIIMQNPVSYPTNTSGNATTTSSSNYYGINSSASEQLNTINLSCNAITTKSNNSNNSHNYNTTYNLTENNYTNSTDLSSYNTNSNNPYNSLNNNNGVQHPNKFQQTGIAPYMNAPNNYNNNTISTPSQVAQGNHSQEKKNYIGIGLLDSSGSKSARISKEPQHTQNYEINGKVNIPAAVTGSVSQQQIQLRQLQQAQELQQQQQVQQQYKLNTNSKPTDASSSSSSYSPFARQVTQPIQSSYLRPTQASTGKSASAGQWGYQADQQSGNNNTNRNINKTNNASSSNSSSKKSSITTTSSNKKTTTPMHTQQTPSSANKSASSSRTISPQNNPSYQNTNNQFLKVNPSSPYHPPRTAKNHSANTYMQQTQQNNAQIGGMPAYPQQAPNLAGQGGGGHGSSQNSWPSMQPNSTLASQGISYPMNGAVQMSSTPQLFSKKLQEQRRTNHVISSSGQQQALQTDAPVQRALNYSASPQPNKDAVKVKVNQQILQRTPKQQAGCTNTTSSNNGNNPAVSKVDKMINNFYNSNSNKGNNNNNMNTSLSNNNLNTSANKMNLAEKQVGAQILSNNYTNNNSSNNTPQSAVNYTPNLTGNVKYPGNTNIGIYDVPASLAGSNSAKQLADRNINQIIQQQQQQQQLQLQPTQEQMGIPQFNNPTPYSPLNNNSNINNNNILTPPYMSNTEAPSSSQQPQQNWQHWWNEKRKTNLALLAAARTDNFNEAVSLLDKKRGDAKADISYKDEEQNTALHYAAHNGNPTLLNFLLYNEAVIDAQNKHLLTPLLCAAKQGHDEICSILITAGADINHADDAFNTALHYASMQGHNKVIELLLRKPSLQVTKKNMLGCDAYSVALNDSVRRQFQEFFQLQIQSLQTTQKVFVQETPMKGVQQMFSEIQSMNAARNTPEISNGIFVAKAANIAAGNSPLGNNADFGSATTNKQIISAKTNPSSEKASVSDDTKTSITEQSEEKIGPSNFIVHGLIGKGSFGEVYLVEKKGSTMLYAMKVLHKSKVIRHNLTKYAMTERNVMSVTNHPFVVRLNYAFQTKDKLFLIMDYCPGGDLGEHLQKEKKFSEELVKIYLAETVLALEDLHKRDVIFRDLKPDNIVLDFEGHVKLTDFGLSKEGVLDHSTGARSFCGSVAYLAPEMLKRCGHGKAVDWYLLGVVMYELLVGIPPYYANNREELFSNIEKAPLKIPSYLSVNARSLLKALLQRNPAKRLGSGKGDAEEIKAHPFFADLDWVSVLERKLKPPLPNRKIRISTKFDPNLFEDSGYSGDKDENIAGWSFVAP